MRKLTVKSGPAAGRSMPIERDVLIGRADADLTIEDPELSRRHAVLRPVDGGVQIEDLGSRNGTFVNGERVSAPVTVSGGATVDLGDSRIALEIAPADAVAARAGGRSRLLIALGVLVAVAAIAAAAIALLRPDSEETEAHTLDARLSAPSLTRPESFQVAGVMTGEPLGRTAVVIQRRLGGNLRPGGPPAPVRGFVLVTGPDGVLSLNFSGTLALDRSGRERLDARGSAANGTRDYAKAKGSFKISGGLSDSGARVAGYRLEGKLEY